MAASIQRSYIGVAARRNCILSQETRWICSVSYNLCSCPAGKRALIDLRLIALGSYSQEGIDGLLTS